jgi:5-methylcytosine-specific restriction endonuclease McrA
MCTHNIEILNNNGMNCILLDKENFSYTLSLSNINNIPNIKWNQQYVDQIKYYDQKIINTYRISEPNVEFYNEDQAYIVAKHSGELLGKIFKKQFYDITKKFKCEKCGKEEILIENETNLLEQKLINFDDGCFRKYNKTDLQRWGRIANGRLEKSVMKLCHSCYYKLKTREIERVIKRCSINSSVSGAKRKSISLKLRNKILNKSARWVESVHKKVPSCENCGKTALEASLEIDHIIPVSKGGKTEENNLQVLCFDCNRGKSNDQVLTINT